MTVRDLKESFSDFNLKTKVTVSDDKEITNNDIEEGKIFQKFIVNENLQRIVDGLGIYNDEIYYFFTTIDRIEIEADDFFPACGGEQEVVTYAYYTIRRRSINGSDESVTTDRSVISAIIKVDNPLFSYEKPYLINREANNGDINNEVNVTATYYYASRKYNVVKHVIQHINTYSSWLVEEEPTDSITINFSENNVSNKGGIVIANVERTFTRIYYKKDSCGNKVAGKSEPGLVENITNKCLITSSNRKVFNVSKNIITVPKQDVGAPERETTITARFLDKVATATLVQAEGGKITYVHELSFENGSKVKFFDLETSIPVEKSIDVFSKEYKYIDGEYDSSDLTDNFVIKSDSEWVYGVPYKDNHGVHVKVIVTDTNTDRENDREASLTFTSLINPNTSIQLIVSQQALSVAREEYHCTFHDDGEYTSDEIDNRDFYFNPYKVYVYENGDTESGPIEEYITYKYVYKSGNEKLLGVNSISRKYGDYFVNFKNYTNTSMKDVPIEVKLVFYDAEDGKLFESDTAKLLVKGNEIVDYNYELCFEGHNKFKTLSWENSNEPKFIKVNSLKHKLVNGKYSGNEQIPYTIGVFNKEGREVFDDSFSVKINGDEVLVFPYKVKANTANTYTITQTETGDKIMFSLTYKVKRTMYKVPLKVIVYSNNIGTDVWTGENGYLLIDGNTQVRLNPCWLSPNMKENVDTAFNGVVELEEGNHVFETFNVIRLDYPSKTHKDCNIKKEVIVDKATKNIILQIKI